MENPIKMDDLGVPPFKETPKRRHTFGTQKTSVFKMEKTFWRLNAPNIEDKNKFYRCICI